MIKFACKITTKTCQHIIFIVFSYFNPLILCNFARQPFENSYMTNVIKLRKGLDINLIGNAEKTRIRLRSNGKYSLQPDDFTGVVPKVVVKESDRVKAGEPLFVSKNYPDVKFSSPVSGVVKSVVRGDRRKVLGIRIDADETIDYVDFGKKDVRTLDAKSVRQALLDAGLFGYINQLPYAVSTTPNTEPKAIFV